MKYEIRYSTIYSTQIQNDNKTLKFNIENDIYADGCILNIREFIESIKYTGPTKNGLFYRITSIEELNKLRQKFNQLFDAAEKQFNK